jgi:hypothetical protein
MAVLVLGSHAFGQSGLSVVIHASASTGIAPLAVKLSAEGSPTAPSNQALTAYKWDFGDNTFTNGPMASHVYNSPGTYKVSVTFAPIRLFAARAPPIQSVTTNIVITVAAPPTLAIDPTTFSFNSQIGQSDAASQVLTIRNIGGAPLQWSIQSPPPWLAINPNSGRLPAGQSTAVQLRSAISGLTPNTYRASFIVSSKEAVKGLITANVVLTLTPASKPQWSGPIAYTGAGLLAMAGTILLVRNRKGRSRRDAIEPHVKPVIDLGVQTVRTKKSIAVPGLRVNVVVDAGSMVISGDRNVIGRIIRRKVDI